MISAVGTTEKVEVKQQPTDSGVEGVGATFDEFLRGVLEPDQESNVSEEELFAALIGERLEKVKGKEAADAYKEALAAERQAQTTADGYVPWESAAIAALKKLSADGTIGAEEADKIYSDSFAGAQLDANTESLYDSRGGGSDPTVAVAKVDAAIAPAWELLQKIERGELSATPRVLETASATGAGGGAPAATGLGGPVTGSSDMSPQGTTMDGSEGFLWKPITNNEQKLAVLLSAELTGHVLSVTIKDEQGNMVEEGQLKSEGIAETGREKWTFSKQGGEYPANVKVEVRLSDGSIMTYHIPDPSQRYD